MNEILGVPAMLCSEISHKDRHNKHRERKPTCPTHSPFSALVARPVKKKEISNEPEAQAAVMKEWNRLKEKKVWLEHLVREWPDVAKEARIGGTTAHVGRVFMICVEKGSEQPKLNADGSRNPDRKFKGRAVFDGRRTEVKDENHDLALFSELSSSPAAMEDSKLAHALGF